MKTLKNNSGFSMTELMFVMVIVVLLFTVVEQITVATIRVVMNEAQNSVAETGAKNILQRMADDIRMAGHKGGGAGSFWDATDETHVIFTKEQINMDGFSIPNNGDQNYDVFCYEFHAPVGVPGNAGYRTGSIWAGTNSGVSTCLAADMSQLSDASMDVTGFRASFCRPAAGVIGTYNCGQPGQDGIIEPGTLVNNSECAWLVRLNIRTRTAANNIQRAGGGMDIATFSTAVRPRNIYLSSISTDLNKNGIVDCCDAAYVGADVTWCPVPTK